MFELLAFLHEFYHTSTAPTVEEIKQGAEKYGSPMPAHAIIGECVLADIIRDSDSEFAVPDSWHWILIDPVFYDKPIIRVVGKPKLWNYVDLD